LPDASGALGLKCWNLGAGLQSPRENLDPVLSEQDLYGK
jgi:hypothetical protein